MRGQHPCLFCESPSHGITGGWPLGFPQVLQALPICADPRLTFLFSRPRPVTQAVDPLVSLLETQTLPLHLTAGHTSALWLRAFPGVHKDSSYWNIWFSSLGEAHLSQPPHPDPYGEGCFLRCVPFLSELLPLASSTAKLSRAWILAPNCPAQTIALPFTSGETGQRTDQPCAPASSSVEQGRCQQLTSRSC